MEKATSTIRIDRDIKESLYVHADRKGMIPRRMIENILKRAVEEMAYGVSSHK